MKRSELETDASFILASMNGRDYEIPTNKMIMSIIFGRLKYVYFLQIIFVVLSFVIYKEPGDLDYQFKKIIYLSLLSCVTMAFFSLVFIAATYSNVCMFLTLGDDVRRDSILLKIVKNKILFYTRLLLIVNSLVGCVLLWAGEPFVAGLGFSWFATFIVSMLFLQGSLSRYMTPAVVSSLSKVKELLSASPK
ncbi:protein traS [Salmonella enterica]|uniref:Protein traS n=2 Tax=Salmonella enterica TaxID=28901 RepID=A0A753BCB4_SALHO|nr:protein traS [Salmonella enterica]EAP4170359.1 protein traS [Salmonella enterica subsp. enterica serovar Minnesota]EBS5590195.1 protein traS [Salmonella enterica subsp. enterica serovar Newport]EBV4237125.1 protein traS [Salmonella enterica subsp. enterica serovar Panama]EBZ5930772.1 protein traS [Salmonella enterica subsp. enterica serovar Weslaco]ECC2871809.1 protein traS [Salmonella enterica subsp. enterica serovar Tanger]EDA2591072.1 protein traS [Salmonella enterica subsp. enterica se